MKDKIIKNMCILFAILYCLLGVLFVIWCTECSIPKDMRIISNNICSKWNNK